MDGVLGQKPDHGLLHAYRWLGGRLHNCRRSKMLPWAVVKDGLVLIVI
jgi:hypothetical protein